MALCFKFLFPPDVFVVLHTSAFIIPSHITFFLLVLRPAPFTQVSKSLFCQPLVMSYLGILGSVNANIFSVADSTQIVVSVVETVVTHWEIEHSVFSYFVLDLLVLFKYVVIQSTGIFEHFLVPRFFNVTICCFSVSFVIVSEESLGFSLPVGQRKKSEYITLHFGISVETDRFVFF